MEAANILALNLMHEIMTGKIDAEKARELYSELTGAWPFRSVEAAFSAPVITTTCSDNFFSFNFIIAS